MNKNRVLVGLFLAVVVAIMLSAYVYRAFQQATAVRPSNTQRVVVAASPLPLGTRLDSSNIRTIAWPGDSPVPGMLTSVESAESRAVITPIAANEMILESKLAPKEAGAGLPAAIPEGMRAISVAVNEVIGVAGFVTPGTSVDVLVTGQIPGATQSGAQYVTRTILENVRVLAAGQKIEQDKDGKPAAVPVVTLLVTPKDAGTLAMASTEGKIQLALRNTIDGQTPDPVPVLQASVFGSGAPPPPPQAPARHIVAQKPVVVPLPYTVEIIVGGKREDKSFPNE
jgi:pilus assembly protein CpaB